MSHLVLVRDRLLQSFEAALLLQLLRHEWLLELFLVLHQRGMQLKDLAGLGHGHSLLFDHGLGAVTLLLSFLEFDFFLTLLFDRVVELDLGLELVNDLFVDADVVKALDLFGHTLDNTWR